MYTFWIYFFAPRIKLLSVAKIRTQYVFVVSAIQNKQIYKYTKIRSNILSICCAHWFLWRFCQYIKDERAFYQRKSATIYCLFDKLTKHSVFKNSQFALKEMYNLHDKLNTSEKCVKNLSKPILRSLTFECLQESNVFLSLQMCFQIEKPFSNLFFNDYFRRI